MQGDFEALRAHLRRLSVGAYRNKAALMEDFEPGLMNEAQRWVGAARCDAPVLALAFHGGHAARLCANYWMGGGLPDGDDRRAIRTSVLGWARGFKNARVPHNHRPRCFDSC
jgi:anti-sigma factor RsiW